MRPVKRLSSWIVAMSGLLLLILAARAGGVLPLAIIAIPAAMIIAGGVYCLLVADTRAQQHAATGAAVGIMMALPLAFAADCLLALQALLLSAAAFVAAGRLSISLEIPLDEVPAPPATLRYSALVALDDAVINFMTLFNPPASADALREAVQESVEAHTLWQQRGWIEDPKSFHQTPPPIDSIELSPARIKGLDCIKFSFDSGYNPDAAIPGRDRWLNHRDNQTVHGWLLRQPQPGPWLICVHPFGNGDPAKDFPLFRARQLYQQAGLNLAFIALPVHGPRAPGTFSGAEFLQLSPLDFVHAEAQAVWDLRRLIGWIRSQQASRIGLYGISLGGYTSALLAGIEEQLDCVICGIPPSDLIHTGERLLSPLERRQQLAAGVDFERNRSIHRVVSPLALAPKLAHKRRFIYAATGDRFVPLEQVRALWQHWQQPQISWCTGGHLSTQRQRAPRLLVDEVIANCLSEQ